MLEHLDANDLVRIAAAGGGFETKAGFRDIEDLVRIAAAAFSGRAQVRLRHLGHVDVNDLVRIASAGKGYVVFADPVNSE